MKYKDMSYDGLQCGPFLDKKKELMENIQDLLTDHYKWENEMRMLMQSPDSQEEEE